MDGKPKISRFTLIMTYVIEFTFCALIGWSYEELIEIIVNLELADRGILHLPLLPIYGFGGMLLLLLYRRREYSSVFIFITSAVITTVLELIASYPVEWLLGYLPWYYGAWPYNFDGRISLTSSVIFGLLGVLFVKVVHPLCRRFENAPRIPVNIMGIVLILAYMVDLTLVMISKVRT